MKKILYLILAVFAFMAIGCQREIPIQDPLKDKPLVFTTVPITLGEDGVDDTKSTVNIEDVEKLNNAILFAFYSENTTDAAYKQYAGKIICDGETPLITEKTEKNFDWQLPENVLMDIYVITNYNASNQIISSLKRNTLTINELKSKAIFTCTSNSAFANLESTGLPGEAIIKNQIVNENELNINIKVKKLYAKYNFSFNTSDLRAAGYTVETMHISASRSNTKVPYFVENYRVTDLGQLQVVDKGSTTDINELNLASSSHAVTMYFLENCQGNIRGASSWSKVYTDIDQARLPYLSYIDLGVKLTDINGMDTNLDYFIYLGDDCRTNFDVRRNSFKTIILNLPVPNSTNKIVANEGFFFTNPNALSVAPGESIEVPFETSLAQGQIKFKSSNSSALPEPTIKDGFFQAKTTRGSGSCPNLKNSGIAIFSASSSARGGTKVTVTGGNGSVQNSVLVTIQDPIYAKLSPEDGATIQANDEFIPLIEIYEGSSFIRSSPFFMSNVSWSVEPSGYFVYKNGKYHFTHSGEYRVSATYTYNGTEYMATGTWTVKPKTTLTISGADRAEVGAILKLSAFFNTYENGELVSSVDVTNAATWSASPSAVSVDKGDVSSTVSCQKQGVTSFSVSASYSMDGVTCSADKSVVFTPHVKDITYQWYYHYDSFTNKTTAKVVASENVPCQIKIVHIGGPNYEGFDGMIIEKGQKESQTYTFAGNYHPGLGGCTPSTYYNSPDDTQYQFKKNDSSVQQ